MIFLLVVGGSAKRHLPHGRFGDTDSPITFF